ncbi:MAG: ArnT family glycosyltransferase, partial [Planctomycetota bacterium]
MSLSAPLTQRGFWFLAAMVLLTGLTLYTRGAAPWQEALTNDEMLHLESWRNRYRTDDIYPVFLDRVEAQGMLEGERLELLEKAYHGSTLVQRGLLVLIDAHPPTYPLLAEVLEALTHSSLDAVRIVSAIASALAVLFAYRLGRDLRDTALGLWLAALFAIGFLAQVHAGIARPYVLTHLALILVLYAFVRDEVVHERPPWRFLLACLFAQSTDWPVWAVIFPLVAIVIIRRFRRGGLGAVVKETWWYAALSVLMLPILALHLARGVAGHHLAERSLGTAWYCYSLASPFASLDWVLSVEPGSFLSPAAILMLLVAIAGVACVVADAAFFREVPGSGLGLQSVRLGVVAALVVSVALSIFGVRGHVEMILIFMVVPTVFAAAGVRWLLRTEGASRVAVVATLVIFAVFRVGWPEDPRHRALLDTDYAAVAERIRAELGPGDIWIAFRRNRADCLYRYGPLPEPVQPLTVEAFREFLATLPRPDAAVLVFARTDIIEAHRILRTAPQQWEF